MPRSIKEGRLRLPVVRLLLKMVRLVSKTYFDNDLAAANAEELVLCCAVFVGHAEGRPMSATKLADYAGIPRSTTVRKLRALTERGLVELDSGGLYRLSLDIVNSDEAVTTAREIRLAIAQTHASVTKMAT